MNRLGFSFELDQQIREGCSDAKDFLDTQLLVTTKDHRQDFLLVSGLSPKEGDIARIQLVGKGVVANPLKFILTLNRNKRLGSPDPYARKSALKAGQIP